ncbi:MAG: hypothetical protein WBG48_06210 [Pricia sp.]
MSTTELKNMRKELVDWINTLEDGTLLNLLSSVKLSNENVSSDWWAELSEEDKENIDLGLKDYEEGKILSSKQFWKALSDE